MSKEKFNSLDRLKLSEQALGCLKNAGINDLDRLSDIDIDLEKLNKVCFMKQNIVNEIVEKAGKIGIKFAPKVDIKDKFEYFKQFYKEEEGSKDFDFYALNNDFFQTVGASYKEDGTTYYYDYYDEYIDNDDFLDDVDDFSRAFATKRKIEYSKPDSFVTDYVNKNYELTLVDKPSKKLLTKRKLQKNLGFNYDDYNDNYIKKETEFENNVRKDLEEFLEKNFKNIVNSVYDIALKDYEKDKYRFKQMAKDAFMPTILFIQNELKELKQKKYKTASDKENIEILETMEQEYTEFPSAFMFFCQPNDEKYDIKYPYDDYIWGGYERSAYSINDKIVNMVLKKAYYNFEGYYESNYKEVFDLIPKEYLQEEFYDKYNPMEEISLDKIPFIPNFIKTCKELSPEKNNSNYSKEVLAFLGDKLRKYNNKITNDIDEYVSYMDDEDIYTEGTGRRGR